MSGDVQPSTVWTLILRPTIPGHGFRLIPSYNAMDVVLPKLLTSFSFSSPLINPSFRNNANFYFAVSRSSSDRIPSTHRFPRGKFRSKSVSFCLGIGRRVWSKGVGRSIAYHVVRQACTCLSTRSTRMVCPHNATVITDLTANHGGAEIAAGNWNQITD